MKKLLLALSMAAAFVVTSFSAFALGENVVANPGFDGMANWFRYGQPTFQGSIVNPATGDNALHINSVGVRGGTQQLALPLQRGETYVLEFDAWVSKGFVQPIIGIATSNNDFEGVINRIRNTQHYSRTFTVPQQVVRDDYRLIFQTNNTLAYIDNVSIRPLAVQEQGEIFARVSPNTPESQIIIAGSEDVHVSTYEFRAEGENYLVDDLELILGDYFSNMEAGMNGLDRGIVSVKVVYPNSQQVLAQRVGFTHEGRLVLEDLDMFVPAGETVEMEVFVDANTFNGGAVSGDQIRVGLADGEFEAVGLASGLLDNEFTFEGPRTAVNTHILRNSKLEFSTFAAGARPFVNGNVLLYDFNVTADPAGEIDLKAFDLSLDYGRDQDGSLSRFRLFANGLDITNMVTIVNDHGDNMELQGGIGLPGAFDDLLPEAITKVKVTFLDEMFIPAGKSVRFQLRALSYGVDDPQDYVSTYFEVSDVYVPNFALPANLANFDIVWSDSFNSWTNGFLLGAGLLSVDLFYAN